jgi:hypothetical protein
MLKSGDKAILCKGALIKECLNKNRYALYYPIEVEVICSSNNMTTVILPDCGRAAEVYTTSLMPLSRIIDSDEHKTKDPRKAWSDEEKLCIRKGLKAFSTAYANAMNRSVASIEWEMYRALKENGCKG